MLLLDEGDFEREVVLLPALEVEERRAAGLVRLAPIVLLVDVLFVPALLTAERAAVVFELADLRAVVRFFGAALRVAVAPVRELADLRAVVRRAAVAPRAEAVLRRAVVLRREATALTVFFLAPVARFAVVLRADVLRVALFFIAMDHFSFFV
ncbi:hypothetical protein J120_03740 [candidate division TM6 bacterium JCVI TM6SC1]|uniref:Uncharacterized protein n=1 Tax=candidate division TM6 bacterium JCVI TM6SC1 TaxID=1306947 RepID=A0A0D2I1D2_9BACT|nr:hypothetical protein J120_03740 [candidate division TM6 bacterium JCVI TM6SC1]